MMIKSYELIVADSMGMIYCKKCELAYCADCVECPKCGCRETIPSPKYSLEELGEAINELDAQECQGKTTDAKRGLYPKYHVKRLNDPNGKHKDCEFFVIDWSHDKFAVPAMAAYAEACEKEYPQLAQDLRNELIGINNPEKCPNCGEADDVYYERIVKSKYGEIACSTCGWCIDAVTGKIIDEGEDTSGWDDTENDSTKAGEK